MVPRVLEKIADIIDRAPAARRTVLALIMEDPQDLTQNQKRKPKKGPGRPAAGESLTPQEVAETALQLILAEGEAALTMRRLGEMLGVKAMALYNHFPNKEAILDAVTSLAMSRLPSPARQAGVGSA